MAKRRLRWWLDGRFVHLESTVTHGYGEWNPPEPWPLSLALNPVDGPRWHMRTILTGLPGGIDVLEVGVRAAQFLWHENGELDDAVFERRVLGLIDDGLLPMPRPRPRDVVDDGRPRTLWDHLKNGAAIASTPPL